ncbi:MAG: insulinase family protein [Blastocatellia bacterium]|nr:insulinase family protein [Blastocatellia bacterium]
MKEDIRETRFDNGLVVLTDRMPSVRSVTLGFFYWVGARHEPTELAGITHFIEHTVFKGTARRNALDIAIEQDRLGGNLDAFTTHEETGFAIKVVDEELGTAFDLIADMLANPRFDDADLAAEQKVIIEEMKMTDDNPEDLLGEIFNAAFFPDHPLGLPITGTPDSVRKFTHEITRDYHEQNFAARNLVIVAAGNVEHNQLLELAERSFNSPLITRHSSPPTSPTSPTPAAHFLIKHKADLEQAHLIIATPFVSARDDRRYAGDLLANVIGGGTSSRLWQKIREERGLAYSVGASTAMYEDVGVFSVFAGTSPDQVGEVVDLTIAELRSVVTSGVQTDELELVKQQARASILLSLEDSASRASSLAQSEMTHGRQISVEETLAKIDAVTVEDCQKLAREFLTSERIAFAAVGDLKDVRIDRERLRII